MRSVADSTDTDSISSVSRRRLPWHGSAARVNSHDDTDVQQVKPVKPPAGRGEIAYALGMAAFAYAFVQRVSPSVMADHWMLDFGVNATSLGLLSGAYFYAYAAMQLPVGILVDRYGARRLMAAAALVCAVASLWLSATDQLATATLLRACIGAAVAFYFVGTLSIITRFFQPQRFGALAGVLQSLGMVGAILGQAPLRVLVEHYGWRGSFVWLAAIALLLAVGIWMLVPRRQDQTSSAVSSPAKLTAGLRDVVYNRHSWLCAGLGFGQAAPMLAFGALWGIPWMQTTHGLSATSAASLMSLLFIGWAIGAPLVGMISDYYSRRRPVMIAGTTLSFLSLAIIIYTPLSNLWLIGLLLLCNGIGGSAMIVMFGSVRELNLPANSAAAMGLANMCVVGSGAVLQPLIGWLLDALWSGNTAEGARLYSSADYNSAFLVVVFASAMAVLCAWWLPETRCRQQRFPATDRPRNPGNKGPDVGIR